MSKFIIEGNSQLSGEVTPSGNKNEALPVLCAALLTEEKVTLKNIPKIGDVLTMLEIFSSMGVEHGWLSDNSLEICAKTLKPEDIDALLCEKVRASILLLGPLLARCKKIHLPLPGGDVIGARRIDTHWQGAIDLGANLEFSNGIIGSADDLVGKEVFFDEPSVTATENILMLASKAKGRTTLYNAACEPHVVGLCRMLSSMGVKITGEGSNVITIEGCDNLNGCSHKVGIDFMEVGSFLCLSAVTGGDIKIKGIDETDLRFIYRVFERIGVSHHLEAGVLKTDPIGEVKKDISGRISTIYSGPWPAFPTDLMSCAIVAATQASGNVIFFEKMFEGRMFFTDKLMAMGANIVLCDPHRIVVNGPASLFAARLSSPDVRAGMALLIASMIAKGTSQIDNISQIERGYEGIEGKLASLGAKIKKVSN